MRLGRQAVIGLFVGGGFLLATSAIAYSNLLIGEHSLWLWAVALITPTMAISVLNFRRRFVINEFVEDVPSFPGLQFLKTPPALDAKPKTEELLIRAMDSAAEAIILTDLMGCLIYANRHYHTQIGTNNDLVGSRNEWRYRFIQPRIASQILDAVARERVWSGDIELRSASGSPIPFLITASPVYDDSNRLRGMLAIHTNVSSRNKDASEYRKFASLVENGSDFIAMMSLSGEMTYLNDAGKRLIGLALNDPIPRGHLFQYVAPECVAQIGDQAMVEVFRSGLWKGESKLKNFRTGDSIHVDATIFLVRHQDTGEPVCLGTIQRDISDSIRAKDELLQRTKQLEDAQRCIEQQAIQLEAAKDEAERANHAKSGFLANMSHEIRTPMTSVLGFTDLLMEELTSSGASAQVINALATIKRNGRHLLDLVNDILDLSKIEAGKMSVERMPCRIRDMISDVDTLFRERFENKHINLVVSCHGLLPETIQTDPTRLRQIIINLLGNALKFTERGTVSLTVDLVRENLAAPKLRLVVKDSGIGMDKQTLSRIFRPFTQAEVSGSRFGGTGLGLAISQLLAQMLGGKITVESKLGEGSTFTVMIDTGPIEGVILSSTLPNDGHMELTAKEQTSVSERLPQGIRVLLVEDGLDNQRLLSILLKKQGATVEIAENGLLAIEMVERSNDEEAPYDIILMDMQMPVMDGYEATTKLRAMDCRIPIIALTANAMTGQREKCLAAGCSDFATKPIQRTELFRSILQNLIPSSTSAHS
ncbi:response regulator [bacterium]|nr:response regulator [bacterium]